MRTTPKKSRRIWGPTEGSRVSAASDLLEREGELAQLGALVGAAREGAGRLVLLEGGAGIGKTRLLAAARERGAEAGMEVLHARGGELEREFPFGIVRQLFEPALARAGKAERRDVLSGAAGLASPVSSPASATTLAGGGSSGIAFRAAATASRRDNADRSRDR